VNRSAPDSPSPVTPDDPRISEWIDGRLDDRAAAEIERAVRDSATLARVVDDLRALKATLGRIEDGPAPAGFVRGVMDAITIPPGSDDAAVAAEWRRLEAERIAEEREEAHEDEVEAVAPRPHSRWPWLALAGALAAGVLVAVVLNAPRPDREVALAPPPGGDAWAIPRSAAVETLAAKQAPAAPSDAAAAPAFADEEIEVVVNAPAGRAAVEELLAASGIVVGDARRARAAFEPDPGERIEVVASSEAIDAFLAAVGERGEGSEPVRVRSRRALAEAGRKAAAARDLPARRDASLRLVIRVVVENEPAAADPAPTGPSPGELEE
jgi:hypothetical protein